MKKNRKETVRAARRARSAKVRGTEIPSGAASVFWSPTGEAVRYDWRAAGTAIDRLLSERWASEESNASHSSR